MFIVLTMEKAARIVVMLMIVVSWPRCGGEKAVLSPEVEQLCDDYWNWRMADRPEFATFVGFNDYNTNLDDLSLAAYENRLLASQEFLERIIILEPTLVDKPDIANVKILRDEVETFIDGYPFKNFVQPLSYMEGPQVDLEKLVSWMPFATASDYDDFVTRISKLDVQMNQIIELLREGVASGILPHEITMNGVVEQVEAFIVDDPEDSPLYSQVFDAPSGNLTSDQLLHYQNQTKIAISEKVVPSFQQLRDYLTFEYVTRPDIAVTSLPNGTALYHQLIVFHTGEDTTPEAIHQKGLEEVDRINGIMQDIVYEMGFNMTTQNFSDMIKNDPANFYETGDELMTQFEHIVYDIITPALPLAFDRIPEATLTLVESPTPDQPVAFYQSGSYDGSRPGIFYVNTYDPSAQPKYEMLTLSLHEGNPGHHLQGSYALESPDIPYFRGNTEDRNYAHAPSRFPLRTYYVEGWGLYAESVGFDMELFGDPLERYGHYSDEMFRACRLVIDTGIHAFGWTKEEAVQYMLTYTAMTPHAVENEVNRYITWPGQALAYKWGELQLRQFRTDAEQQLQADFSLQSYHDVVLESVGPMSIVEESVNLWIASVLNSTGILKR